MRYNDFPLGVLQAAAWHFWPALDASMAHGAGLVAGVDVGGTFTDLLQLDQGTGAVRLAKVPSTPDNQADGVLDALNARRAATWPRST